MALASGARLGPYEILAPLGAGGMGEVYRARDTRLDRDVAVKILPPQLAADPQFRERFDREARAVSALDHPNICPLYDVGEAPAPGPESAGPVRFLVMQLLEGETLAERLEGLRANGTGLVLDEALRIATQVCDALDHAHRIGVVHRDLKPANIFLTKTGPKLLDFGLAKRRPAGAGIVSGMSVAATQAAPITASGTILGTLQYMAPEQLEGQEADSRADIFSFGAVLYEMITGRKAFDGKSQASLIAAILHIDPPAMTTLQPVTPVALERVVTTCLAKNPDDRWQTARDLLRELKWAAEGATTPVPSPPRAAQAKASRVAWALASVCGVAAIIGGVIAIGHLRETPQPARTATRFSVTLPAAVPLLSTINSTLALSPDGTRLVYVGGVSAAGSQLYLRAMDQLEAAPIRGTEGAAAPFFSPDGQWLGFFADNKVKKISIDGGSAQTLAARPVGGGASGSWGSDDTIVFSAGTGPLLRISAAGGVPTPLTTLNSKQGDVSHRWPEILPGGKAVLFVAQGGVGDQRLMIRNADTGEQRALDINGGSPHYVSSGHLLFSRLGTLFAAPFDLKQLRVTAPPVPVVEGVASNGIGGAAHVSIASNGSMAFVPGVELLRPRTLVWVDRQGKVQPLIEAPRNFREARLSPDGQRIAIGIEGSPRDLWIYEIKRGILSRFTLEPTESEFAAWTPDGQRIAFGALRPGGQGRLVLWKLTDGSGTEEKLLAGGPQDHFHPSAWSPDGRVLAFTNVSSTETTSDIWMLPLGKTVPEPFANTRFSERSPRFSPDGKWVAYVSDESGRDEIYVQPYPGPGGKRQVSIDGGSEPVWASSGRELFYWIGDTMMAVSVATAPSFSADAPRRLFEGRFDRPLASYPNFDVTADGQRFLMFKGIQAAAAAQITVVLDWATELARRVPIPR